MLIWKHMKHIGKKYQLFNFEWFSDLYSMY